MGADLYIRSLFDPVQAEWEGRFEEAVKKRDALPEDSPEREAAQQVVVDSYEQMYARGYFRDPYNSTSLLWRFGLSWWTDVGALLDDARRLHPEGAQRLLAMLEDREALFEEDLQALDAEDLRYYREEYATLRAFLEEAIRLKEPIECSI